MMHKAIHKTIPLAVAPGSYLHWGVIQISLTNFLIVVLMLVVFVLAITIPFSRKHAENSQEISKNERRTR